MLTIKLVQYIEYDIYLFIDDYYLCDTIYYGTLLILYIYVSVTFIILFSHMKLSTIIISDSNIVYNP